MGQDRSTKSHPPSRLPNLKSLAVDELIKDAFAKTSRQQAPDLVLTMQLLARCLYGDWAIVEIKKANPAIHHLVVLEHSLQLCKNSSERLTKQIATCALIHDSQWPAAAKITSQQAAKQNPITADQLTTQTYERHLDRLRHVYCSAQFTAETCDLINRLMGEIVYDEDDIFQCSQAVAQHDLGSLGHRIESPSALKAGLVVADNLWMVSYPFGPQADVLRRGDEVTDDVIRVQLRNNLSRYRERIENALGSKEPAIRAGREICKSHLEKWAEYFGIAVETLEDEATTDKKH